MERVIEIDREQKTIMLTITILFQILRKVQYERASTFPNM
jgi:hypothetical protein